MHQLIQPVDAAEFAELMMGCGPFEAAPHLVVGCSGGPDSLALSLLLHDWCRARGGLVTAVIVDHHLRSNSSDEARQVLAQLTAHDIAAVIKDWHHPPLHTGLQQQAALARRQILIDETIARGALHLALGHHADDQVETLVMRAERDTGWRGWAGMAPVREDGAVRLLRPLLGLPKSRLRATCAQAGWDWVEDPGNLAEKFRRGAIRQRADHWDKSVFAALNLAARDYRHEQDRALALIAANFISVSDHGVWWIDPEILAHSPLGMADWLAPVLAAASGSDYPPGASRIIPHEKTITALLAGQGGGITLAGAVLRAGRARQGGGMMVFREPAACVDKIPVEPAPVFWDGRFWLEASGAVPPDAVWGPLGAAGLRQITPRPALPSASLWTQPALWHGTEIILAPSLKWHKNGQVRGFCRYQPRCSLS